MPNWCQNRLHVTGPAEDIKSFRAKAHGHTQSYNEFSPHTGKWPVHDDIRMKSLIKSIPDPGDIAEFSFHALYPVPEEFRCFPYDDTRAKELGDLVGSPRPYGGYGWEGQHWGCKWGACDSSLDSEDEGYLEYDFSTAWGPPVPFLDKVSADWPNLSFELTYDEAGMGFRGSVGWCDGELVSEDYQEYDEEEDEEDE